MQSDDTVVDEVKQVPEDDNGDIKNRDSMVTKKPRASGSAGVAARSRRSNAHRSSHPLHTSPRPLAAAAPSSAP